MHPGVSVRSNVVPCPFLVVFLPGLSLGFYSLFAPRVHLPSTCPRFAVATPTIFFTLSKAHPCVLSRTVGIKDPQSGESFCLATCLLCHAVALCLLPAGEQARSDRDDHHDEASKLFFSFFRARKVAAHVYRRPCVISFRGKTACCLVAVSTDGVGSI